MPAALGSWTWWVQPASRTMAKQAGRRARIPVSSKRGEGASASARNQAGRSDGDGVIGLGGRHRAVEPIAAEQHERAQGEGEHEGAIRVHWSHILSGPASGWRSGRKAIVSAQHHWSRDLSGLSIIAAVPRASPQACDAEQARSADGSAKPNPIDIMAIEQVAMPPAWLLMS